MGWKMLRRLYQQAVLIAKTITMKDKEDEAVTEFTKYLNSSELYFNEHPFPENESNEEAYLKCKSVQGKIFIDINLPLACSTAFPGLFPWREKPWERGCNLTTPNEWSASGIAKLAREKTTKGVANNCYLDRLKNPLFYECPFFEVCQNKFLYFGVISGNVSYK